MRREVVLVGTVAVALAGLTISEADAGKRNKKPNLESVQTPLGTAGRLGSGANVVLPFTLAQSTRRKFDLETEWAVDRNLDGVIADGTDPALESEYRTATISSDDQRSTALRVKTSKKTGRQKVRFRGKAPGALVWDSGADVDSQKFLFDDTAPDAPQTAEPGARVRVRIVHHQRKKRVGEWIYTDAFPLDNRHRPIASVVGVLDAIEETAPEPNTPYPVTLRTSGEEPVTIVFQVTDADSEDANGNGVLDEGEDRDSDGELDAEPTEVRIEWAEFPATNPPPSLGSLDWNTATAHTSSPSIANLQGAPGPNGREYVLVWDATEARPGTGTEQRVILRVSCDKVFGPTGSTTVFNTPVVLTFAD